MGTFHFMVSPVRDFILQVNKNCVGWKCEQSDVAWALGHCSAELPLWHQWKIQSALFSLLANITLKPVIFTVTLEKDSRAVIWSKMKLKWTKRCYMAEAAGWFKGKENHHINTDPFVSTSSTAELNYMCSVVVNQFMFLNTSFWITEGRGTTCVVILSIIDLKFFFFSNGSYAIATSESESALLVRYVYTYEEFDFVFSCSQCTHSEIGVHTANKDNKLDKETWNLN